LKFSFFSRVFLFASPRTSNYNEFVKESCFKVYLNPWSKEECREFAESIHFKDEEEWLRRFHLVGGKPRYLFSSSISFKSLRGNLENEIPQAKEGFHEGMKHLAFSIYRNVKVPSLSCLTYSSLVAEAIVNSRFTIGSANEIRLLLKTPEPTLQSWRGKQIEKFLLQDLATATFSVKSLEEPNRGNIQNFGPFNAKSKMIEAASDTGNELMLHIPLSKTFPAIDGVLVVPDKRCVIYAQSTVSLAQPIKLKRLEDVYNTLMQREEFRNYKHMLLFIVPNDIWGNFTFQRYKTADGEKDIKKKSALT